jgi:hypothetical protein
VLSRQEDRLKSPKMGLLNSMLAPAKLIGVQKINKL